MSGGKGKKQEAGSGFYRDGDGVNNNERIVEVALGVKIRVPKAPSVGGFVGGKTNERLRQTGGAAGDDEINYDDRQG